MNSTTNRGRGWRAARLIVAVGAISLAPMSTSVAAAGQPAFGATSVFATLPYPGHLFGIAVDTNRIYVSTSRGDFFANQTNSDGERVFALNLEGKLLDRSLMKRLPRQHPTSSQKNLPPPRLD